MNPPTDTVSIIWTILIIVAIVLVLLFNDRE